MEVQVAICTTMHQPQLHEAISQSLAGRTAMLTLWPFSRDEVRHYQPVRDPFDIIYRGCFPRLHEERLEPRRFYNGYLQTYLVKGALNKGIRPEVYFFRDSHGNEVDLLIREKGALTPIEIKSGGTFSNDFLKGLERFTALEIKRVTAGAVLYNGERRFSVRDIRIFNPLLVDDIWKTLCS